MKNIKRLFTNLQSKIIDINFKVKHLYILIALILFITLLFIKIPGNSIVTFFIKRNSPELLNYVSWENAHIQLISGVILENVKIKAPKPWNNLQVKSPELKMDFNYFPLIRLKIKIDKISADSIIISSNKKYSELAKTFNPLSPAAILFLLSPISDNNSSIYVENFIIYEKETTKANLKNLDIDIEDIDKLGTTPTKFDISAKSLKIDKLTAITKIRSTTIVNPKSINIESLTASFAEGKIDLNANIPLNGKKSSSISLNLKKIKTLQLMKSLIYPEAHISTIISAKIKVETIINNFKTMQGKATIDLGKVEIKDIPLQRSKVFKMFVPRLSVLYFSSMSLNEINIKNGLFKIAKLKAISPMMDLEGSGFFNLDGFFRFNFNASLPQNEIAQLPSITRNASKINDDGSGSLEFTVSGNLDQQKFTPTSATVSRTIKNTIKETFKNIFK